MKKTKFWWIGLVVACTFGAFMAFFIREVIHFLFAVFLFIIYGVCCALDEAYKRTNI